MCQDVLKIITDKLIPTAETADAKVFYHKMYVSIYMCVCSYIYFRKADYYRYLAEIASGDKRKEDAEKSLQSYKHASEIGM